MLSTVFRIFVLLHYIVSLLRQLSNILPELKAKTTLPELKSEKKAETKEEMLTTSVPSCWQK